MGFWSSVGEALGEELGKEYKNLKNKEEIYRREKERCKDWDNEYLRKMHERAKDIPTKKAYYEELMERRERGEI